jgi:hypothetical protein
VLPRKHGLRTPKFGASLPIDTQPGYVLFEPILLIQVAFQTGSQIYSRSFLSAAQIFKRPSD